MIGEICMPEVWPLALTCRGRRLGLCTQFAIRWEHRCNMHTVRIFWTWMIVYKMSTLLDWYYTSAVIQATQHTDPNPTQKQHKSTT